MITNLRTLLTAAAITASVGIAAAEGVPAEVGVIFAGGTVFAATAALGTVLLHRRLRPSVQLAAARREAVPAVPCITSAPAPAARVITASAEEVRQP